MFQASGEAYDAFMGRYSTPLAAVFAEAAGIEPNQRVLDVGCGPGALTGELVARVGATNVVAADPSPPFVEACRARHPGVTVHQAPVESLPVDDAAVDAALAQLVFHFVGDPERGIGEMRRVVRPGGTVAACVWDFEGGMQMLRMFWDAAVAVDPAAPDELLTLRFGREGELAALLDGAELTDVREVALTVESSYGDFDELWSGFQRGIGPAGTYCTSRTPSEADRLRTALFERVGAPSGSFALSATARAGIGTRA